MGWGWGGLQYYALADSLEMLNSFSTIVVSPILYLYLRQIRIEDNQAYKVGKNVSWNCRINFSCWPRDPNTSHMYVQRDLHYLRDSKSYHWHRIVQDTAVSQSCFFFDSQEFSCQSSASFIKMNKWGHPYIFLKVLNGFQILISIL